MAINQVGIRLSLQGQQELQSGLQGVNTRLGELDNSSRKAAGGAELLKNAMAGIASIGAVSAMVKMADAATQLQNQLRLSSNSAREAGTAYTALFEIAQQSRVSFTELGTTYAAIARSGRELGVSQDRLLKVTQSISQAMTISGGSAASMQAALVQLGQGLSSGTLRGEELNSIMEQTPRLAKALADGLGVPIGALRELGAAGQLTSEQVIKALEKAGPQLAAEMASATLTVGQAFTLLSNSAVKFTGEADTATGVSAALATALKNVSSTIDTVGAAIKNNETAFIVVTGGLAGAATLAGVVSLSGVIMTRLVPALLAAQAAAGPIGWITLALGALGGAAIVASKQFGTGVASMGIDAEKLAKQITAIDTAMAAGLNTRGYKATEADKAQLASMRATLVEKKKLIDQEIALKNSAGLDNRAEDARFAAGTAALKQREQALAAFSASGGAYLSTAAKNQATLNKEITTARTAFESGAISAAEYAQRINDVQASFKKASGAAPGLSEAAKANASAVKADIAAFQEMDKLREKSEQDRRVELEKTMEAYAKAAEAGVAASVAAAVAAETELANYGLLKSEVQALTLAHLEQSRESAAMAGEDVANIETRIAAQKRLIAATRGLEGRAASEDAAKLATQTAKDAADEWKKTSDQINSTLTDALMRGFESGKGFARTLRDTVVNMFKTMVLRPIISAVMSPISAAITGGLGLSGAANAASGGANALSAVSTGASAYNAVGTVAGTASAFGSAFSAGMTMGTQAFSAGVSMMGSATGASSFMAGAGQALGAVALPALAAVAVLAAVGAFRTTKQTGTGISGTLGDDQSLTGFNEMRKSGYLFGGPKYWDEIKAIDPLMAKALKTDFANIKTAAMGAADALGLASDSVAGFSKAFRIEFTGDRTKDEALYKDLMAGVSEDLARTIIGSYKETITTVIDEIQTGGFWDNFDPTITKTERQVTTSTYTPSEFAKEGETASQTLQRLATSITLVNGTSDLLGNALLDIGLKGANTASLLIDAFGGAEAYAAQLGSYYQNFYSQSERTAKLTETTSEAFAKLGLTMPALDDGARAAYRALVETAAAQDMTVEANRNAYSSLLALQGPMNELAPTFDSIAQATVDMVAKMQAAVQNAQAVAVQMGITTAYAVAQSAAQAAYDSALRKAPGLAGYTEREIVSYASDPSKRGELDPKTWGVIDELVGAIGQWNTAQATERSRLESSSPSISSYTPQDSYTAPDTSIADAIAAITKGLTDAGVSLGVELLKAQGKVSEAMAAQRAIDTAGYNAAQVALYDYNQTLRDQITAASEATESAKRTQQATADYELAMFEATGDTASAAIRQRELATATKLAAGWTLSQIDNLYGAQESAKSAKDAEEAFAKMRSDGIAFMEKQEEKLKAILSTNAGLRDQLAVLEGSKTQQQVDRANQLADATDSTTQALLRQIFAQQDTNASAQALQEAATTAAEALKTLTATNKGYQDQLDVLTGKQTDRSISLRDAADASTAALMRQVYAQQDVNAASEKAAESLKTLTATNKSYQDQLDVLTGAQTERSIALRDTTDDTTRALMRQVYAQQDSNAASEKATEAASTLKAAYESLESARVSVANAFNSIKDKAEATATGVVSAQEGITQGYLSAQDAVAAAQQNIADITRQAAQEMRGFSDSIKGFLLSMATTDIGSASKADQFAALQSDFAIASAQARAGDKTALGGITGKAGNLLVAGKDQFSNATDFARFTAGIGNTLSDLATLADGKAGPLAEAVDPMVKAQADLLKANQDLAKWGEAASKSGASTARTVSDYLADWRTATAANSLAQSDLKAAQLLTNDIDLKTLDVLGELKLLIAGYNAAKAAVVTAGGVLPSAPSTSMASTSTGYTAQEQTAIDFVNSPEWAKVVKTAKDEIAARPLAAREELYTQFIDGFADAGGAVTADAKKLYWEAAGLSGLPSFAVGTNRVPYDMTARIHKDEAIVPAAFNPFNPNAQKLGDTARLEKLVDALTQEVIGLRAEARSTATHTSKTAALLDRAMPGGDAISTRAAA